MGTDMENKFKGKEPEDLFLEIFRKCEKLGVSPKEFSKLSAIKKLRSKNNKFGGERFYFCFLSCLILICAAEIGIGYQPLTLFFAKIWFYFQGYNIESEMCVLDMPTKVQDMFMPPFDCSICRNLTEIERVAKISPENFENRFAYSNVPVIVSDGATNWTALDTFSFEFFRQLYLGDNEDVDGEWDCQFFGYQTEFMSLAEVLNMSSERASKPWYIGWGNCDHNAGNILRTHYSRPYFLPQQSESSNVDWIFMGTPGYGAHLHVDRVYYPSWQAQIKGSKLWTLEPAPECYNECPTIETVVYPGEVIVLDTNRWYHKTLITGKELSITIGSEFD